MFRAVKNASLYVGAIIGAGFASGSEIALFFNGQNIAVVLLAGLLLGGFSGVFLYIGNSAPAEIRAHDGSFDFFDLFPKRYARILRSAFFISALVMLAAMTAGAESIFREFFGVKHIGIVSLIPAVLIALSRIERLKSLFAALVAVIAALIVVLYVKNTAVPAESGLNLLKSVSYTSMNVFLGGYLIVKKEKAEKREIFFTSFFSALTLTALLYMIYCVNGAGAGEMPVIEAAASLGYGQTAAVVVFLAVFSTMISTAKSLYRSLVPRFGGLTSAFGIASIASLVSLVGFSALVAYAYPAIGLLSSGFTAITAVIFIKILMGKNIDFNPLQKPRGVI
ncbi:MAG: hypothetical protein LBT20_02195 [Clostridiales bacterium]|jgi:uncharacterized membrane protein YkvI|nr:hypothetical protein [Clostridiales bacterium]